MSKILAVTLARGGSKGIPKKNITNLAGKPLIDYTIEEAQKSSLIDRYIVSTDDLTIKNHVESLGLDVPFLRPKDLSDDKATSAAALKHAVLFCEDQDNCKYDYVVELMCTNPFKKVSDIDKCIKLITSNNVDSVIGVSKLDDHHPARIKKIEEGFIRDFAVPELSSRRQDLKPEAFIRNGSIYAINRDRLVNDNYRFGGDKSLAYIMEPPANINIDNKYDLMLAEIIINQSN